MNLQQPKLIVFDWDGTLMDSEAHIVACLRGAVAAAGAPQRSEAQLRDVIGLGLAEAIEALFPGHDRNFQQVLADGYRRQFLSDMYPRSEFFDGVPEMLAFLRARGYRLAVATGKGRRGLDHVLQQTGVAGLFEVTRCADETRSKPHPMMLQQLMASAGVSVDDTLLVGDTEYDLEMAANCGVSSIGVSCGVHSRERLLAHQPLAILEMVTQIVAYLDNLSE